MSDEPTITSGDKRQVQSLLLALEPFLTLRNDDTVSFRLVIAFLNIVANEGRCAAEYAQMLGIERQVMSRYVHELADCAPNDGPGLDLVRIIPEKSGRNNRKSIFLTAKGHDIATKVISNLRPVLLENFVSDDLSKASGDKRLVQSLLSALEPFSTLRSDDTVPFQGVITFLNIVMNKGQCAATLARSVGVDQFLMGRYVHDLADRARDGRRGLGLVRIIPEKGGRNNRKNIFLTAKGRAIATKVLSNLCPPKTSEAA